MKSNSFQKCTIIVLLVVFSMLFSFVTISAAADTYPSKAIRLIIPFAPGGSNDIVGRLIAAKLTERLHTQVIIDNRAGAGGVVGTELAAKAPADGYTLVIVSAAFAFNPALYKVPFDPIKDFAPIAKLGAGPNSFCVHPSIPANTIKEFVALLKQKPGFYVNACSGAGSFQHLGTELFKLLTGTEFKIVQFKGGGPAMVDLLGGHSHFSLGSLIQMMPHIQSGKFKVLGTGGAKRIGALPNVPTIAEAGVPGYEATNWWGILAPARTPGPVVERLTKEIKAVVESDEVKNLFLKEGADVDFLAPVEFASFIEREITKWTKVVKDANIKLE